MSIRERTWITNGITKSALVVCWTDANGKRRLKTFSHMRHAKAFHLAVCGGRPAVVAALEHIRSSLIQSKKQKITLTRYQAELIVKAFQL